MTIVCKSHDIVNYIINPIYESWDKITPDINPKYEQMHWPCQLYLSLMEFRNNIFNPIYESEDKITQYLDRCIGFVLMILKRYGTCI